MMETKLYSFFIKNRRKIRVLIFLLSMFFQLGAVSLGSMVQLTEDEANKICECLPLDMSWDIIAFHNIRVSMFKFLPLFGIWWTGFTSFNTGILMKAIATRFHRPVTNLFFRITFFPHYWLEQFAYSIALTAGLMFFLSLFTLKRSVILYEVKCLIYSVVAWAAILVVAGLLEVTYWSPILWIILLPLIAAILERASGDSLRLSGMTEQTIFIVILFVYFALWGYFSFIIRLPFFLFGVAMYVLLGYYLFETLTNGWLRRQILGPRPIRENRT